MMDMETTSLSRRNLLKSVYLLGSSPLLFASENAPKGRMSVRGSLLDVWTGAWLSERALWSAR